MWLKRHFHYTKAYDMKNKFSSFERHFKMEKNVVFLFMVSFAVLEIFTILYYANKITFL